MTVAPRVTDYDRVADGFDRRYSLYDYVGVRESLLSFIGDEPRDVLEVGCGTGHWLAVIRGAKTSVERAAEPFARHRLVGVEPSMPMLRRASGLRVRGAAEQLPFPDAAFDRMICVNTLHHFRDRMQFFREARRVLRPGGGLMTIGKDPHAERDAWWVYDYFPETREIDRARFAPVRILRGELANAGFTWAESFEADRIEGVHPATSALDDGIVDPSFTSQLTVLTPEEFAGGVARMREANAGGQLQLVSDFLLFATVGWISC